MRVIAQIPHDTFGITLFSWNQKFLLKFEYGNFEQTFKVHELDTAGEAEVRAIASNPDFIQKITARFEQMQADWNECFM